MDAFLLKQVITEFAAELPGALVSKVHQPGEKEIVLELWGRGEKRLLLSADPELCRIHLTTRKTPNPPSPPRFCQFLRKHLEGMRIAGFSVAPYDRSVRIDFVSSRPDAEHAKTSLYAELFGRHANLIYVDGDGTILEPLRTVTDEESRIREVVPGIPYRPLPRPARVFLPDVTLDDAARIFASGWDGIPKALQENVAGIGREVAHEAATRGREGPDALHSSAGTRTATSSPGSGHSPAGNAGSSPSPARRRGSPTSSPSPPPTRRRTPITRKSRRRGKSPSSGSRSNPGSPRS
jgi:predicted ribosome quality control (RQC) complex YloA/Tae2 family protein